MEVFTKNWFSVIFGCSKSSSLKQNVNNLNLFLKNNMKNFISKKGLITATLLLLKTWQFLLDKSSAWKQQDKTQEANANNYLASLLSRYLLQELYKPFTLMFYMILLFYIENLCFCATYIKQKKVLYVG